MDRVLSTFVERLTRPLSISLEVKNGFQVVPLPPDLKSR